MCARDSVSIATCGCLWPYLQHPATALPPPAAACAVATADSSDHRLLESASAFIITTILTNYHGVNIIYLIMSIQGSSPLTGSQPDMSKLGDVSQRKRKMPECHRDFLEMFSEFQKSITSSIKSSLEDQNENIKSSLNALREDLSEFKQQMHDINLTTQKLSDEQSEIKSDICTLKSGSEQNNQKVVSIAKDIIDLQCTVTGLSQRLQIKEQQGRLNNLEISGIPVLKSENLINIVHNIAKKIGFPLTSSDIDYVHRVRRFASKRDDNSAGSDTNTQNNKSSHDLSTIPNIIVVFTQRKRKSDMLAAVRARRGLTTVDADLDGPSRPIFISDHLTPQNKLLYRQVRLLAKEKDYKYVWLSDCKIFVRKNDTSKVLLVSSETDLIKIK